MKVAEIIERIEELEELRAKLGEIAGRNHTSVPDENIIEDARDIIKLYADELMRKDVKM